MPQRLFSLPAPAKLNLMLHVVGRRPDGYHNLQMIFVLIDWCDRLDLEMLPAGRIERTGDIVGDPQQDLCVRAARLLQEKTGCEKGVRIGVHKRIPSGAGLGGGSSDAATTLLGLNVLWDLRLSRQELCALGLALGADVPFFIFGRSAWAQGVGEQLEALSVPQSLWCVAMPPVQLSTPRVFKAFHLTKQGEYTTIRPFPKGLEKSWPQLPGHNDLQPLAEKLEPQVATALQLLGPNARMTGSGAAVFAWMPDAAAANQVLSQLPANYQGFVAQSLPEHPLYGWCLDKATGKTV